MSTLKQGWVVWWVWVVVVGGVFWLATRLVPHAGIALALGVVGVTGGWTFVHVLGISVDMTTLLVNLDGVRLDLNRLREEITLLRDDITALAAASSAEDDAEP